MDRDEWDLSEFNDCDYSRIDCISDCEKCDDYCWDCDDCGLYCECRLGD